MEPEEFARYEEEARRLIAALRAATRQTRAAPGFVARVLSAAAQRPVPRAGRLVWMRPLLSGPVSVQLALATLLVLALIGAVPQYMAWINAWRLHVPPRIVHEARVQERLWQRNFACAMQLDQDSQNYAAITGEEVVVVVWACPSGDVLVTVESPTDAFPRRSLWIAHDEHLTPQHTAQNLSWFGRPAYAARQRLHPRWRLAPMVRVLCQQWLPRRFIKRRVQRANGRCQEEVLNPRTGRVVRRYPVQCDQTCDARTSP